MMVRPAVPEEAELLVRLIQAAYREESPQAGWTSESHLVRGRRTTVGEIRSLIGSATATMLVGETAGEVVACCQVRRQSADEAYFGMFAVAPARQSQGVGRRMMDAAEDLARKWGCTSMSMQVISRRRELIEWYARMGYSATGERSPFPVDDPEDMPIVDGLEFLTLAKDLSAIR